MLWPYLFLPYLICCCNPQCHQFFSIKVWVLFCIDNSPIFVISRFYQQVLTPTSFLIALSMAQLVICLPTTKLPYSSLAYPALLMSHGISSKLFCWNENSVDNSFHSLNKNGCFFKPKLMLSKTSVPCMVFFFPSIFLICHFPYLHINSFLCVCYEVFQAVEGNNKPVPVWITFPSSSPHALAVGTVLALLQSYGISPCLLDVRRWFPQRFPKENTAWSKLTSLLLFVWWQLLFPHSRHLLWPHINIVTYRKLFLLFFLLLFYLDDF